MKHALAIKMPLTADVISKAVALVGTPYPRDRYERMNRLNGVSEDVLSDLDRQFLRQVKQENGGFEKSANEFAESPQD